MYAYIAYYLYYMFTLAPRLHISKEARVGLLVAVEICVWHSAQKRVVRSWLTWNFKNNGFL